MLVRILQKWVQKGEKMYSRLSHSWLKHWDFILLDIVCLQVSFLFAFIIRHGAINTYHMQLFTDEAMILFVCQLLVVFSSRTFSGIIRRGYYLEFVSVIKHVANVMVVALVVLFAIKETSTYSRIVLLITAVIYALLGYMGRQLLKIVVKRSVSKGKQYSLVIVTMKEKLGEVVENLKQQVYHQYSVEGICLLDEENEIEDASNYSIICGENHLLEYVQREWVDGVMFMLPTTVEPQQELLNTLTLMGIATHVPILGRNMKGSKQFVETMGETTVLTTSINIVGTKQMTYKRMLDLVGGFVGCVITILLTIIVGPIIYCKSPGPIFFKQTRIGKNGRQFTMYKFRSMYMDAEERKKELMDQNKMDGYMFKIDHDPRIIGNEKIGKNGKPKGIGNFIRKTSIDEFPQFWNVLKGDMSLVGTRPPTLDEWEKYEPHHRARMAVKPGITGMWQVSGRSDITDFEEVVKLDTEYIEEWNFGLDIKILFMTVLKVLKNDGAV